jgi:hypothetical protein
MKKLYEEQKVSLYKIQKDLNLNIMRLYRYAEGVIPIDKMPTDLVLQLAYYFKIEPNELVRKMLDYEKTRRKQKGRINN